MIEFIYEEPIILIYINNPKAIKIKIQSQIDVISNNSKFKEQISENFRLMEIKDTVVLCLKNK